MGEVIVADNVSKIYDLGDVKVNALKGITLRISEGEFISIMGASGSGKSTFMNILGCLDKPTSGSYYLDNTEVSTLDTDELAEIRNKKIGFVFQNFNLLARATALENVELPLIYDDIPSDTRKKRAREALGMVGLSDRENHFPTQLSGGQQQRVAIARAMVNDPSIVLADEPTGNLDSEMSEEIMGIISRLNTQGKTIIIITHEPEIAEFTKRNVVFKDGLISKEAIKKH